MRSWIFPSLTFLAVIGCAALLWQDSARQATGANLIGQQAPLDHPLIGQGEPVLINFWFSTCAPCRVEHPVLMDLAGEGRAILGVNRDVATEMAVAFLDDLGDPYAAILYDPRNEIAADFQIETWPSTVLVAGNGIVQAVYGPLFDPGVQSNLSLISSPEVLFADPVEEARAQALFARVTCLDCEANTVRESGGDFALQLRKVLREQLRQGLEEEEIRTALIARYGPQIWQDPPLSWTSLPLLYGLPFFTLIAGAILLLRRGRGR